MILSIETSTKICSVALHNEGVLLAETTLHVDKSHSEKLAIIIRDLLAYAEVDIKDLQAIAVSSGPGSYTGLRIGVSTTKGLCYALNIPLIAVNTLEAMAKGISKYLTEDSLICPMLDARRMEVYCLLADSTGKVLQPAIAKIIDENSFLEELSTGKVVFLGNGAPKCKELLANYENAMFIDTDSISAVNIGELAWSKYQQEAFEDVAYFEPKYLKEFRVIKPKNLFA